MLQRYFKFLPEGTIPVNDSVAVYNDNKEIIFYTSSGPIYSCSKNDSYAVRLGQGIIVTQTETTTTELAKALNINRTTVFRNVKKYKEGGPSALYNDKHQKKPHKIYGEAKKKTQKLLNSGLSVYATAKEIGVTEGCVRHAIKNGLLTKPELEPKREEEEEIQSVSDRSKTDSFCNAGVGVKRNTDRALASFGKLKEASPCFQANEGVPNAGVLLALPVISSHGLLEVGSIVFKSLSNGFYGLQSILLTLVFMGLLRIKTPEQLKRHNPGELGILLGLDRFPEVKTIRRKLNELGLCKKAGDFASQLSAIWSETDKDALGFLYIDGHVRPYHGRKHKLPKNACCQAKTLHAFYNRFLG
jgi:hypothetical protein